MQRFGFSKLGWLCAAAFVCLLAVPHPVNAAATKSKKMPIVPKWERFDHAFKSKVPYSNPLQDAALSVRFTSPLDESFLVYGFWDGGKIWRVRFSPNQPGRWTYRTSCSDVSNRGLNNQEGEFLCTSPIGPTRFNQHGLVRLASDHRHFEHADGTPFFWLADTAWDGTRLSEPKAWNYYAGVRAMQRFTVAQWSVASGFDSRQQSAYTGYFDRIAINPDFFKRLDAKVDTLAQAGILSAIAPLAELESQGQGTPPLSDGQAALFVRYVVARYGGDPVAWVIPFDGDVATRKIAHWKHVGPSVFGPGEHAPVILAAGENKGLLDEFRDQTWVDAFALQSVGDMSDDSLKWACSGPLNEEAIKNPPRPLLQVLPRENGLDTRAKRRFSAEDIRHAAYWTLLAAPPAGVTYSAQGVANWDLTVEPQTQKLVGANFPMWQKSMFMSGAKQMSCLAAAFSSFDFSKLQPAPKIVAVQAGDNSPQRFIAAARTQRKNLSLIYNPEERTLELALDQLPTSPAIKWFNPRTGQLNNAVAVVTSRTCQFPTPEPGDWLLTISPK